MSKLNMNELEELNQAFGRMQQTIINNNNDAKDRFLKLETDIKRLDIALSGLVTTTRENTEWLSLVDKAIKALRETKELVKEVPKVKTFFDWLKQK